MKIKGDRDAGTDYEWKVKTVCAFNTPSSYGPMQYFTTSAACVNPTVYSTTDIMANNATMNWNSVALATEYKLKLRPVGGSWIYITLADTFKLKNGLTAATDYQWKVKTVCNSGSPTSYGPQQNFTTAAPPRLSSTASQNREASDISVYPNPTTGFITVVLGQSEHSVITIRNIHGQIISRQNLTDTKQLEFELAGAKGLYTIEVMTNDGQSEVFRIVKE